MGIQLSGTVRLPSVEINGRLTGRFSGLAWDQDEKLLYAISDNAHLFKYRLVFKNQQLMDAIPIASYSLVNKKGKRFWPRDAEGLAIVNGNNGLKGDSELIVSFERAPQIVKFTPQGQWLKQYPLPKILQNPLHYANPNAALEAVTLHPTRGILTSPERPLKSNSPTHIMLYALNDQRWQVPRHPAPQSSVVAMETLADGSILVMERAFISIFRPLIISLRRVCLTDRPSTDAEHAPKLALSEQVAEFNNTQGWNLDNFEGLTHHRGNFFLMISDDNQHPLQKTLFSYFKLL